jgi:hypothetical protein
MFEYSVCSSWLGQGCNAVEFVYEFPFFSALIFAHLFLAALAIFAFVAADIIVEFIGKVKLD